MPLYLHKCIPQLTPVISIAIAVIANSVPQLLTRWWYGSDFIEFHEKGAVSFWFGNGRLGVLTVSLLYNVGRLIYVCLAQDVVALLIAARVLGYIVQLYDHYWMQHYWLLWFVQAQKRTELWLRFYLTIIAFLSYALVDQIQVGIVGNYQIYFHQYVLTTMFYTSMLFCLVFWFMWFLLPFTNIHPTAARSPSTMFDVQRMVRYRFHIMRNSVVSWIPFLLMIGIVGVTGGDDVPTEDLNDNNLQWRYPFMVAAVLVVVAWVLHRYTVAPYDRLMLRGLSEHTPEAEADAHADADADADARVPAAAAGPPASFVQVDITRPTAPGTRQPPPRPPEATNVPPVSDDRDGSAHPPGSDSKSESGEASTAGLEQLLIAAMSERQTQSQRREQQHQQGVVVPGGGVPPSERSGAADANSDSNSEAETPPAALEQLLVAAMSERQTQSQRREQSRKDPSQSQVEVERGVGPSERSAAVDSNSNSNSATPPSNLEEVLLAATTEQRLQGAVDGGGVPPSERSAVADAGSDNKSVSVAPPPSNLEQMLLAATTEQRQLQEGVVPAPMTTSGQNDGTVARTVEVRPQPVPEPGPEPSPRLQSQERLPPLNLHLDLPATTGSNRSGSAAAASADVAPHTSRRSGVSIGDGGASSKTVQATPRRKALTVRDIRRAHRASLGSVAAIGSDVGGGAGGYVNSEGEGSNKNGGDLGNGTGEGSAKDANDTGKGGSAKSNDNERDIEGNDGDGDDDDEGSSRRTGRLYRMPTLNKLPSQISELSMNVSRRAHSLAHLFPFDVVDLTRPLEIKKWEIFERNADKAVRPRRWCAPPFCAPRHRHRGRLLTALWPVACLPCTSLPRCACFFKFCCGISSSARHKT